MRDETAKVYRPQWEDSPYNHFAHQDTLAQREWILNAILEDYCLTHTLRVKDLRKKREEREEKKEKNLTR